MLRIKILTIMLCLGGFLGLWNTVCEAKEPLRKPNFIIVFTDDQGYQDLGVFGSPNIKTPRIDALAKEGRKFTNFYAQTVCGPSRAALMTGCYPLRLAKLQHPTDVHPFLHPKEITIAEVLKGQGYRTGMFGKWDMAGHYKQKQTKDKKGYNPQLLPQYQGFDYFFGTPASNDKVVNILRNDKVIEEKADMAYLTKRYTDEAVAFIERNHEQPFFVYLAHSMPHTLIDASPDFKGKSSRGLYGDVIEEIDFNVGKIVDKVKALGLENDTYIFYFSDNGPWWIKGEQGGTATPLRGAKTSTWDGGVRVPCVMWAPGRIPAGTTSNTLSTTMDMLPTIAELAGTEAPSDRKIDGHSITRMIHGKTTFKSPTKVFYYYQNSHLQALRVGKWKLHVPRPNVKGWKPHWSNHIAKEDILINSEPVLYNLDKDIGEQNDVAHKHPKVVERLMRLAEEGRKDIGDYNRRGEGIRNFEPFDPRPDVKNPKIRWR